MRACVGAVPRRLFANHGRLRISSVPLIPSVTVRVQASSRRTLFDDLLASSFGTPPLRHLTHSQTLPYSPDLLFKTISSVDRYPEFLPFLLSSRIIEKDGHGLPKRAQLRVGYNKLGVEEDWESIVNCDQDQGIVEARGADESDSAGKGAATGLFRVLRTRWDIKPASKSSAGSQANLSVHVQLRNPVYDQLFAQVEDRVARAIAAAFEKRVAELARLEGKK